MSGRQSRVIRGPSSRKLLVTILIAGLNNSALAAGRLVLPLIALSMGASTWLVGVIAAMFTACPMVLSIWFGRWVDRSGSFLPIIVSGVLIAAASFVFIAVPSTFALLAVAGFIGSGAVFSHVAATRAVGTSSGDGVKRARNLGYLILVYSLFQFIGPIISGFSLEHSGSEAALLTIGGFGGLSLILVALRGHYYKPEIREVERHLPRRSAWELFSLRALRKWILVYGVFSTAQTLYPLIISLHAARVGLTPSQAGILLGAFAGGVMLSRAATPIVVKHIARSFVAVVTLLSGALIYSILPFTQGFNQLFALSALLGLPIGLGTPISLALIYETAPDSRINESVGLCMSVTNLLQTTAPLTLGIIASGAGVAPMIWGLAVVMVMSSTLRAQKRIGTKK